MKFDELLTRHLGEFGRYQKWQFFLLCLPTIFAALHSFSWSFTAIDIPYRCRVINETDSDDFPFFPSNNYTLWLLDNATGKVREPCKRQSDVSVSNYQDSQDFDWELSENGQVLKTCSNNQLCTECLDEAENEWKLKWDNSQISQTAIKRWTIVCNRRWLKAAIQSVYYIGQFFGSIVWGVTADKYGRKTAFFIAIFIQVVCGASMAYVPWLSLFAIFRTLLGFAHPGIFMIAVVLGMELLGPSRRMIAGGITGCFFSSAQIYLGGLAYLIRDYQQLQLTITLPALIFICYIWLVPESARWLISQGRLEEADEILQKAAKCNNASLPRNWYQYIESAEIPKKKSKFDASSAPERKYGFCDLMKTPKIRRRTLICCVLMWPSVNMAYYGLAMNPNFLGGDIYMAFIIGGILDIVSLLIYTFSMNTMGRKALIILGYSIGAICLFTVLALPDKGDAKTFFVLFGKMNLTGVQGVVYIFTPELFPAVIRSMATGLCSMGARVGVFGACWISFHLVDSSKSAVVIIYGTLCVFGAFATIFLPETTGQCQIETVEEAESFGSDQPLIVFGWQMTKKPMKLVPSVMTAGPTVEEGESSSAHDGSKKEQSQSKSKSIKQI